MGWCFYFTHYNCTPAFFITEFIALVSVKMGETNQGFTYGSDFQSPPAYSSQTNFQTDYGTQQPGAASPPPSYNAASGMKSQGNFGFVSPGSPADSSSAPPAGNYPTQSAPPYPAATQSAAAYGPPPVPPAPNSMVIAEAA